MPITFPRARDESGLWRKTFDDEEVILEILADEILEVDRQT